MMLTSPEDESGHTKAAVDHETRLFLLGEDSSVQPLAHDRYVALARNETAMPEFAGRDLADIVKELGGTLDEVIDRLIPAGAIYYMMDDADVQRILKFDETMIGSDGLPHDVAPHPRLWGSFPRVLGHYGRNLGLFTLETAVHKMTGLTAKNFGLSGRGLVQEGAYADLTLFNPETIASGATYESPKTPAIGIHTVLVNGAVVWAEGKPSGARPGRVLRREAVSAAA